MTDIAEQATAGSATTIASGMAGSLDPAMNLLLQRAGSPDGKQIGIVRMHHAEHRDHPASAVSKLASMSSESTATHTS